MGITIGEIANVLLPYSNDVDINISNEVPFLRARLSSISAYTKAYMYVVQTGEHTYACCDSRDDLNGDRFFPTGSTSKPFVIETDIIRSWFGSEGNDISYKYDSVVTDLTFDAFIQHLYERLSHYHIIRLDKKYLTTRLIDMGFTSVRIKRAIDEEFKAKKCHQGTISDLIDIIVRRNGLFSLSSLRSRESKVIVAKLKEIGITVTINSDNCINSLKFDKCKGG